MATPTSLRRYLAALFVLALLAGACGRDDDTTPSAGSTADVDTDGDPDTDDGTGTTVPGDATVAATPAVAADCAEYNGSAGITDSAIRIGSSFPASGIYASYAEIASGYEAYFTNLNDAEGGIGGRRIELDLMDDQYESGNTISNYEDLREDVFALLGVVGTANNLAIRGDQNADCLPSLFLGSGSQFWGNPTEYPWTIGSIPTYPVEMAMLVQYLEANLPDATVAFLYQNDDFGKGYFDAFNSLIEGTGITVIDDTTYDSSDPDTTTQITSLSGSNADVLVLATTTLACPNALGAQAGLDWEPLTYISATCTSSTLMGFAPEGAGDGVLSGFYLKDPLDPQWAADPGMIEFQTVGAASGLDSEQTVDGIVAFGWTLGGLLEEVFSGVDLDDEASRNNARELVMNAAWNLDQVELPMLLPGITVTTNGAEDPYLIESMRLGTYNGELWELGEDLYNFEGTSAQFSPPEEG